jgi:hypothetical protein
MKRSPAIFIGLSLIALTNIFTQCRKDNYYEAPKYSFKLPVDIRPYNLSYAVGDTVWLHLYAPGKMLFDTLSKTSILYDSANFSVSVNVHLLFNNPFIADGTMLASFIYTQGISAYETSNQSITYSQISFGCNQRGNYDLIVGIVFLKKGVFALSFFGSVDKCFLNASYNYNPLQLYFNVNDSHLDFYNQLPFAEINQQPDFTIVSGLTNKLLVCVNVH